MDELQQYVSGDLASVEADVNVVVTIDGDDTIYSLHLSDIRRVKGELMPGPYKAIILILRQLPAIAPTENPESC